MKIKTHRGILSDKIVPIILLFAILTSPILCQCTVYGSGLSEGDGKVKIGSSLYDQFFITKTLDVSNLNVNISITEAEKNGMRTYARQEAEEWLTEYEATYVGSNERIAITDENRSQVLQYKTEELYNIKLGEAFKEKLGKQLDGYTFDFMLEEISEEETAKFKIDGDLIQGGRIKEEDLSPLSTVSFSGKNQLYDEILVDYMDDLKSSVSEENWEVIDTEVDILRNGRDIMTHTLLFDRGRTDSSGNAISFFDGDWDLYGNVTRFDETIGYTNPLWLLPDIFNFYLNPASDYIAGYLDADVISNVEFDSNGTMTSISKPLFTNRTNSSIATKIKTGDMQDGKIYRFKLVEKDTTINDIEFKNEQEFVVDVSNCRADSCDVSMYSLDELPSQTTPRNPEDPSLVNFVNKGEKKEVPPTPSPKPVREAKKEQTLQATTNNPNTSDRKLSTLLIMAGSAIVLALTALSIHTRRRS